MTTSTEIPALCDQLVTTWSDSVHCAYWLGIYRARAHEHDSLARVARVAGAGSADIYRKLRDDSIREAERCLAELKAALAKERQA
jgi:hypothetical protein